MASPGSENMDGTVTIEKTYFDTLLRRSEHHVVQRIDDRDSVVLSKTMHDDLLKDCRDYYSLRQALSYGGISLESLDCLVQGGAQLQFGSSITGKEELVHDPICFQLPVARPATVSPAPPFGPSQSPDHAFPNLFTKISETKSTRHPNPHEKAAFLDAETENGVFSCEDLVDDSNTRSNKLMTTLLLSDLPESVTHKEITAVIRGGALVDIWLRRNDRSAAVSFAEGAREYLAHAKRNGIYIRSKLVEVNWSERQYTIAPHLRMKLANGHSRNLVIRGALGRVTDEQIRLDMEHIHNLFIIATVWTGQDVYISTNSVNNATFARNCMISRLRYKAMRIEWYPDECAEALPKPAPKPLAVSQRQSTNPSISKPITNRFDLLSLEDDDSTSVDDSSRDVDEDSSSESEGLPSRRQILV